MNHDHFVLISAPGSGKGTFSQYMIAQGNHMQVCPGDILRNEIDLKTTLGQQIEATVNSGQYVEESLVCNLMKTHILNVLDSHKNIIVDGFPRSVEGFNFLNDLLHENKLEKSTCFIQLKASDKVCAERIKERLVCGHCFRVYNLSHVKPQQANTCDACNNPLKARKADVPEIVTERLSYFHDTIEPLMQEAAQIYACKYINAERSIQDLQEEYDVLVE